MNAPDRITPRDRDSEQGETCAAGVRTDGAVTASRRRRPAAAALLLCAAMIGSSLLAQPASAPEPLVTQAARQIGIKRCLPVIAATARRVTAGATKQDIILDWDRQAPDAGPIFSLTGMQLGAQSAALTISAMPATDGRCSLLVERISMAPSPCSTIAQNDLSGMAGTALVPTVMVYASPQQPNETYTLIGSGQSCLIIRRQTMFNWPQRR